MAQLIVRKLEDKVVRKLKQKAAQDGVSMEEELRRILRGALLKKQKPKMSFGEFLISPPYIDLPDSVFKRKREMPRDVLLE